MDRPRCSRAFTLLEAMLAGIVGLMVVLAAMTLFTSLQRAQDRAERVRTRTMDLATAHRAMARAFQSLLMEAGSGRPGFEGDEEEIDPASGRFVLSFDTDKPEMMHEQDPAPPQRIRLALTAPPVLAMAPERDPDDERDEQRARAERDVLERLEREQRERADDDDESDLEGRSDDAQDEILAPVYAPGVIGEIELRRDAAGADGRPSWSLWWRQLAPDPGPVYGRDGELTEGVLLAAGLRSVRWELFRERRNEREGILVEVSQLPAYITMEVLTARGAWHQWMFEVGWSTGPMPTTLIAGREPSEDGSPGSGGVGDAEAVSAPGEGPETSSPPRGGSRRSPGMRSGSGG